MEKLKYINLGGGMVAGYAAKELASRGLKAGELAIVSADTALPYERPPLSKSFLAGKDDETSILINGPEWYREHGIEARLNTVIEYIDPYKKLLRSSSGEEFECQHLLLATGARARKLDCYGNDLGNVFYLRSLKDSATIRSKSASTKEAVIIGGGFIGMEVASVLAQKSIQTTLVIREDRVWSRVFTPSMSAFFEQYYAARGVRIVKEARVASLEGKGGVQAVLLGDGKKISCDCAVVGVGAVPVTELLEKAGLTVDNGIVVNEYLEATGRQDDLHQRSDRNVSATVGTRDAMLVELQLGGSARHRAISIRSGQVLREERLLWRYFRRDRASAFRVIVLHLIHSTTDGVDTHQAGIEWPQEL